MDPNLRMMISPVPLLRPLLSSFDPVRLIVFATSSIDLFKVSSDPCDFKLGYQRVTLKHQWLFVHLYSWAGK